VKKPEETHILVVDDEEDLRTCLAEYLELEGYIVKLASNGKQAFEIVKQGDIDIILSDVRMAGGDGISLLENVRKLFPVKPALYFITGYAEITSEDAVKKGAQMIFHKPVIIDEIINEFTSYLKAIS
jgi:CheY-like chemotaxis protein